MPRPHVIQWPDSGFGIRLPARFLEQIGVRENAELPNGGRRRLQK
nr:hypothetical protein [uncultured Oscillibacter sp.]